MKKRAGTPIYMQKIDAKRTNWCWQTTNYIKNSTTSLADAARIKDAMEFYNTDMFQLYLQLRRQAQAENGN
jgi:hypothetical protein